MSGEDREKERLRATPLFTSSSKVQDTLSFINVGSCYWLPRRLLGKEERKMKKKKTLGKTQEGVRYNFNNA